MCVLLVRPTLLTVRRNIDRVLHPLAVPQPPDVVPSTCHG